MTAHIGAVAVFRRCVCHRERRQGSAEKSRLRIRRRIAERHQPLPRALVHAVLNLQGPHPLEGALGFRTGRVIEREEQGREDGFGADETRGARIFGKLRVFRKRRGCGDIHPRANSAHQILLPGCRPRLAQRTAKEGPRQQIGNPGMTGNARTARVGNGIRPHKPGFFPRVEIIRGQPRAPAGAESRQAAQPNQTDRDAQGFWLHPLLLLYLSHQCYLSRPRQARTCAPT